jgi:ribose 5-phosphate isomerase B
MPTFTLALASDHAGYELKQLLRVHLETLGHKVLDFGPPDANRTDYPDHVHPLAQAVATGQAHYGVAICGSGQGVAITANKHKGVRAALVWRPDVASLARQHNDANVVCLPARYLAIPDAFACVEAFLSATFEGGRHAERVHKIEAC